MHPLTRYPTDLLARQAAQYLVAHGVMATVLPRIDGITGMTVYEVMIASRAARPQAEELLSRAAGEPLELGDAWEEGTRPDLSLLDPSLAPACPACDATLPLDASIECCPSCAAPVDVPELIARHHGPDALAPCYPDTGADIGEDLVRGVHLLCPACAYDLHGLPEAGLCPECGRSYDKRAMIRDATRGRP
jgi:hypothetical protein